MIVNKGNWETPYPLRLPGSLCLCLAATVGAQFIAPPSQADTAGLGAMNCAPTVTRIMSLFLRQLNIQQGIDPDVMYQHHKVKMRAG
jgi:hypothetical protein